MHVLILPSWYPAHAQDVGGVFFREQALALQAQGVRVGVLAPKLHPLRDWRRIRPGLGRIREEVDEGLPTLRSEGMAWLPRSPRNNRRLWIRQGLRLAERYMARHGRPDLIHVHAMLHAGSVARVLKARYGIPFIVTEHSSAYARGRVGPEQMAEARIVAQSASRRLVVSCAFGAELEKMLGPECGSWEELPNIVDRRFVETPLPPIRQGPEFRFANVAMHDENKRIDLLLEAFARAFGGDPDVGLDLGGDGPERPRLEARARELGIAERVRFLGMLRRDQVLETMAEADAVVLSSRYETFGVALIEALALGRPVVATRCGGPESIIREQDGLLVPPDDVQALATALKKMRAARGTYCPRALRADCVMRFGDHAVMERLIRINEEVLGAQAE